MRAPGSMDPSTVAEARNAAILGFQSEADDPSDDLAAQAVMQSGADPSKRAQATKQTKLQTHSEGKSQQQFGQGLQMAQTDTLTNRFAGKKPVSLLLWRATCLASTREPYGSATQQRGMQGAITGALSSLRLVAESR